MRIMKSQQKENKLTTSCKDCVFAVYDGDTQFDCRAGRIDVFAKNEEVIDAYDNDKSFYVIKRLCNFYREEDWINEDDTDVLAKVKNEATPSFGVVIYNLSQDTNKQLDKLKDIINQSPVDNKKIYVVLIANDQSKADMPYFLPMVDSFKEDGIALKIVSVFNYVPKQHIDALAFKHVIKRNYLVKIDNNDMVSGDVFDKVNQSLNTDLDKVSYYQDGNVSIISSYLVNHTYQEFNDYHILDKEICRMAKEKGVYKNIGK